MLILVQLVIAQSLNLFPRMIAIDFYQYWAIGAAPRLSDQPLGSPYTDHRTYTAVVQDYAARSGQTRLTLDGRVLGPTGFTATPLLYVLFAALPADYTMALTLYHVLQIILFLAAVILLGAVYRYEVFPLLCLAFLLVLGSGPLSSDLRLGNLGCFQLAALCGLLYIAVRLRSARRAAALGSLLLTGLTLLVFVKPQRGPRRRHHGRPPLADPRNPAVRHRRAAGRLLRGGGGDRFVPVLRLLDDLARVVPTVFGRNPYALARPPAGGNYSTTLLLSRGLDIDVWAVAAAIAAILAVSLIATVTASVIAGAPPAGCFAAPSSEPSAILSSRWPSGSR